MRWPIEMNRPNEDATNHLLNTWLNCYVSFVLKSILIESSWYVSLNCVSWKTCNIRSNGWSNQLDSMEMKLIIIRFQFHFFFIETWAHQSNWWNIEWQVRSFTDYFLVPIKFSGNKNSSFSIKNYSDTFVDNYISNGAVKTILHPTVVV